MAKDMAGLRTVTALIRLYDKIYMYFKQSLLARCDLLDWNSLGGNSLYFTPRSSRSCLKNPCKWESEQKIGNYILLQGRLTVYPMVYIASDGIIFVV